MLFLLHTGFLYSEVIRIPAEQSSIQKGIHEAAEGDTVLVSDGVYLENINFLGKAITVGSMYLMDQDPSHISNTFILGRGYYDGKISSTVFLGSGEDTTSVLEGFTVSGGRGTLIYGVHPDGPMLTGGGILLLNSGAKILNNRIFHNQLIADGIASRAEGAGIYAYLNEQQTAIIRGNTIQGNTVNGRNVFGAGIGISGCSFLVENNTVRDNRLIADNHAVGAGLLWNHPYVEEGHQEMIIRNNLFEGNVAGSRNNHGYGAGICIAHGHENDYVEIYNNILSKNISSGYAGGMYFSCPRCGIAVYNNTIYNNTAELGGNSIGSEGPDKFLLFFNNIIWSSDSESSEFWFYSPLVNRYLQVHFNLLGNTFLPGDPVEWSNNIYCNPLLEEKSYSLAAQSQCIGGGTDSIEFEGTWFKAPQHDYNYSRRSGNFIIGSPDIGAIESSLTSETELPEIIRTESIALYPNPVHDVLTVENFDLNWTAFEVYDQYGKLVFEAGIRVPVFRADLSCLNGGAYHVSLRSANSMITRSIVKL